MGVQSLGAKRTEIIIEDDLKHEDFCELFNDIKEKLQDNLNNKEKTFVFFYYSGHGLQDNMSYAACNEMKDYPMERTLRTLATI